VVERSVEVAATVGNVKLTLQDEFCVCWGSCTGKTVEYLLVRFKLLEFLADELRPR